MGLFAPEPPSPPLQCLCDLGPDLMRPREALETLGRLKTML